VVTSFTPKSGGIWIFLLRPHPLTQAALPLKQHVQRRRFDDLLTRILQESGRVPPAGGGGRGASTPVCAAWRGGLALGASEAALDALGNVGQVPRRGGGRGASRVIFLALST